LKAHGPPHNFEVEHGSAPFAPIAGPFHTASFGVTPDAVNASPPQEAVIVQRVAHPFVRKELLTARLLAAGMLCVLLAACGSGGASAGEAPSPPAAEVGPAEVEALEAPPSDDSEAAGVREADLAARDSGAADARAAADPESEIAGEGAAARGEGAEPSSWTDYTLDQLTLREKVGQLMMPWVLGDFAPEGSASHERILGYIEEQAIGGVIISVGTPFGIAAKLNDLQAHAALPLLVAADLETGAGFRMRGAVFVPGTIELGGATDFPSLMALGAANDPRLAYEMGRVTATEARAVGIHVPFAPVLDVNNNPGNPIINVRSFGEDPDRVSQMGAAFVRGVQDHGAIATGKHFPGHGDTEVDSHLALPVIRHDRARMDSVELRPFQAAIGAGMGGIMTAHISVPSLNGGIVDPSTLSPLVLTNVLRDDMGFDGVVFTDAMDMSAIARRHSPEEAAVRAIEAGADVIVMPPSVERAIEGIVEAVESGRLPEARIDDSVRRLLALKASLHLDADRFVPLDRVPYAVGVPEHMAVADSIAKRSITLLKNDGNLIPLRGTRSARVMSVTYRRGSDLLASRYFDSTLRGTYPRLLTAELNQDSSDGIYEGLLRQARGQQLVIVSTYVTAVSYSGTVAIPEELVDFIRDLRNAGIPHVVVSFGNPYLIADFPGTQAYMLAWNGSEASQRAAARALLGEAGITGRLPTRIPPHFEIGDGLSIPMTAVTTGAR
jgi:beta-N-acetylhexosaminidase